MIVHFTGPRGGFGIGAELILLFRDNVQHHLQGGIPSPGFARLHRVADVVSPPSAERVPASELWEDVSVGFARIRNVERRELAMSIRTRAILTRTPVLPAVRGTALVRLTGWRVPVPTIDAPYLGDLFAGLVTRLAALTSSGRVGWEVEVRAGSPAAGASPPSVLREDT
jgi:hypothetical protein